MDNLKQDIELLHNEGCPFDPTDILENPEFDGGADVGCWAVGATCWKKWLKATKEQANG